jgi:oligopeptidase B
MKPTPPIPQEIPHRMEAHGKLRVDPFFWMKERNSPKVEKHLKAENRYVKAVLAPVKTVQKKILKELKSRIPPDDQSLPYLERGYYYYRRFEKGKEYPVYARKKGSPEVREEILLNVNKLAKGHDYCDVPFPEASPDGTKLAYVADFTGRRFYDLFVLDIASGKIIDKISQTGGVFVWAADSQTLLFAKQDPETLRSCWIFRRKIGGEDELVFEEKDETFDVSLAESRTGTFLFIVSNAKLSTEWRVLRADQPKETPKVFLPRERDHEYSLEDTGEGFFVLSNWRAENFRLFQAPYDVTTKKEWTEIIPHRVDVLLEGVDCFRTHYVLSERYRGQTRLTVVGRNGEGSREIEFPDPVYVAGVDMNQEFEATFLRYRYESLHRPTSFFDYVFSRRKSELRRVQPVPGYDASLYQTARVLAPARDGTLVPVSLVFRKNISRNGKSPLLVYGYGSYGLSMEPWFQSDIVSLLDRGFVYAIAHVRGGSEMGRAWYENGKLKKKCNTFYDFIDATEFLVREKYGDPARIYANGGSAGGLLMGVIANERPDLRRRSLCGCTHHHAR